MIANRTTLTFLSAAIAAAAAMGWASSPAHAVTNMLANPGFENGTGGGSLAGWSPFNNAYAEGTSSGVATHTGDGVAKMFGSFFGPPSGLFQAFPTTPGTTYQMHVFSYQMPSDSLVGTTNLAVERIAFFDGGGNEIGAAGVQATVMDGSFPTGTWIDNPTITATAPAGAVTVQPFLLFIQPNNQGGSALFDDATFSVIPEPASLSLLGLGAAALVGRRRR